MMKKILFLGLTLVLGVCMLTGCGKKEPENTNSPGGQFITAIELKNEQITAENVSPYKGKYLEYDDEEMVDGIYAMKFTNTGDRTIREAQLVFSDGAQELTFRLEMLPAGQSIIVAEWNQLSATSNALQFVDGTITRLETGLENNNCVKVSGNKDGTVQVENTTDEMLPLIRIFYRPTDENGNMIGGPCNSILVDGIESGASATAEGGKWTKGCVVVTVLVANE